jgi:hypothetical protein
MGTTLGGCSIVESSEFLNVSKGGLDALCSVQSLKESPEEGAS